MTAPVDVSARLVVLKWTSSGRTPFADPGELVFHALPADHWIFSSAWSSLSISTQYISFRVPNQSVTRELGDIGKASDALLKIDRNRGFIGIRQDHGVVGIPASDLVHDSLRSGGARTFQSALEHVPYPANILHAEIWIFEVGKEPADWREGPRERIPDGVKKEHRRVVSAAISDRWVASGEPPFRLIPANAPLFINMPNC